MKTGSSGPLSFYTLIIPRRAGRPGRPRLFFGLKESATFLTTFFKAFGSFVPAGLVVFFFVAFFLVARFAVFFFVPLPRFFLSGSPSGNKVP